VINSDSDDSFPSYGYAKVNGTLVDPNPAIRLLAETFPNNFADWIKDQGNVMWLPTDVYQIPTIVNHLDIHYGDTLFELGSGDCRVLAGAFILSGGRISCVGYEKRPSLLEYSRRKLKILGLEDRIKVERVDFFKDDLSGLSEATKVYLYLSSTPNWELEEPLLKYLPNGAIVLSKSFAMSPNWDKFCALKSESYPEYFKYRIRK